MSDNEYTMNFNEKNAAAAFKRIDENRRDIAMLREGQAELRTALVGLDGENGIRGVTRDNAKKLIEFVAKYDQDRENARKERRATTLWSIGTLIAIGGLFITILTK
jgi:hypothetical protein